MKKTLIATATVLMLSAQFAVAQQVGIADELRNLYRLDLLPSYREGVIEQFSSYDPTGGNDDGFNGTYSFIRKENGKLVVAEMEGPGVINRIWTPTPTRDTLEFYFNHHSEPDFKICFEDIFGAQYPFVRPVCNNEVGGYYCYFPIPYSEACKVVLAGEQLCFFQLSYRPLEGRDIKTFSLPLSEEESAELGNAVNAWSNIDPSPADFAVGESALTKVREKTFTLKPGQEKRFFKLGRGGRICGLEIEAGEAFSGLDKDFVLKARWDGETEYAVNAPAADFFGYSFGLPSMRSMLLGYAKGRNYALFPAPFDRKAEVSLKYEKREGARQLPAQLTVRVTYNLKARDKAREGKFYAFWHREEPAEGQYYPFLRHRGRGHYVGVALNGQNFGEGFPVSFEGDDSTYVDGRMRMHGTGSEDFFNGGWYGMLDRWDRPYSLPVSGCLDFSTQNCRTGGYRFYINDKVTFEQEIYTGIEHGEIGNKVPVDYSSMAFFYSDTPCSGQLVPTEELRRVPVHDKLLIRPQTMHLSAQTAITDIWWDIVTCTTEDGGFVRVDLDQIPEGRYHLTVEINYRPDGSDFSVWQRQHQLTPWLSSYARQQEWGIVDCGEIEVTPQSNSISFKFNSEGIPSKEFAFGHLHLARCK